jgi:hypothetical protein
MNSRSADTGRPGLEVFGHLRFALDDPAPTFDVTLGALAGLAGLDYPINGAGAAGR